MCLRDILRSLVVCIGPNGNCSSHQFDDLCLHKFDPCGEWQLQPVIFSCRAVLGRRKLDGMIEVDHLGTPVSCLAIQETYSFNHILTHQVILDCQFSTARRIMNSIRWKRHVKQQVSKIRSIPWCDTELLQCTWSGIPAVKLWAGSSEYL